MIPPEELVLQNTYTAIRELDKKDDSIFKLIYSAKTPLRMAEIAKEVRENVHYVEQRLDYLSQKGLISYVFGRVHDIGKVSGSGYVATESAKTVMGKEKRRR